MNTAFRCAANGNAVTPPFDPDDPWLSVKPFDPDDPWLQPKRFSF
jgi:rRNA maturation protein Nop10